MPDEDALYRRVHRQWFFPNGTLNPGLFRDHAMSTDWARYSSAEEARRRARTPDENAVISLIAGELRAIEGRVVEHAPLVENRAHTEVVGDKKSPRVRRRFADRARMEISLP